MFRAMKLFMQGIGKLPFGWRLWLMLLGGTNMIGGVVFFGQIEGKFAIGAIVIAMAIALPLTSRLGYTRLLGLMHVAWIPLVVHFCGKLAVVPADVVFGMWIRAIIILNSISLVIDVIDVGRYIFGDRKSSV